MSDNSAIRVERFEPELIDGVPAAATLDFLRAVSRGFHESQLDADDLGVLAGLEISDNTVFTAVYDEAAVQPSLHADAPVATYAAFPGTLNIGGGNLMPVHQITSVTVSPTHRRRGLLRRMITPDLERARESGAVFAALTASEATIYGRFGFGRATQRARFKLKTDQGVPLRGRAEGSVVAVAPAELKKYAPAIFAAAHARTLGSISATRFDVGQAAGEWADYDSLKPVPNLRAALHLDAQGKPDGFMSYLFSGWKVEPPTMEIGQMCTVGGAARRELIAYLGAHDLVEKITGRGPVDDVLPTALENARAYKATALGDHLWLRILDLETALTARTYAGDGRIVLRIRDSLGMAEGTWELAVEDSAASVRRAPEGVEPAAGLDVRDLGSLYLGGFSAAHLAGAGVLEVHDPGAVRILDSLFATATVPYCQADF
ncbi:GNAT family N-acetyltransferase [Paeniglutamicibacter sp. ABSL32-1]|uniref:GNAT family N-acetyltransferase n=1 Tax=Paeniglutamicibacter quisquiliarum TaxID=2849498 RepID=UPI001C2D23EB|nr:GNAT family N-acetyltransferase [Paeniglutamicibacter quisquiliarum]MBV1778204.1 GNAT family N-acetyltransferase [Paeniglutamicibacter quisquiliarum]